MSAASPWRTETRFSHLARRVEALPLEKRVMGRRLLRALRQAYGVLLAQLVLVAGMTLLIVVSWPPVLTEAPWQGVVWLGMVALTVWATWYFRRQAWTHVHDPDSSDGSLGDIPQQDAQVWKLCEDALDRHPRRLALHVAREFVVIGVVLLLTHDPSARFVCLSTVCLPSPPAGAPCWLLLRNLLAFLRGTGLPASSPAKRGLRLLRGSPARGQA